MTNSAVVQVGTLSTTGTGAIDVLASATLDGPRRGTLNVNGNVTLVGGQTVYTLGTLRDSNLTIGADADLRIVDTNNLTPTNTA